MVDSVQGSWLSHVEWERGPSCSRNRQVSHPLWTIQDIHTQIAPKCSMTAMRRRATTVSVAIPMQAKLDCSTLSAASSVLRRAGGLQEGPATAIAQLHRASRACNSRVGSQNCSRSCVWQACLGCSLHSSAKHPGLRPAPPLGLPVSGGPCCAQGETACFWVHRSCVRSPDSAGCLISSEPLGSQVSAPDSGSAALPDPADI